MKPTLKESAIIYRHKYLKEDCTIKEAELYDKGFVHGWRASSRQQYKWTDERVASMMVEASDSKYTFESAMEIIDSMRKLK